MYTGHTWQDYTAVPDSGKLQFIVETLRDYRDSAMYTSAIDADAYADGRNTHIMNMKPIRFHSSTREAHLNRIPTNIFGRLLIQLTQYLLVNGVTVDDKPSREIFSYGFDKTMQDIAYNALKHGVAYGFYNNDTAILFRATEYVPLLDERSGDCMLGIRFWQLNDKKPLYFQVYEADGVTEYAMSSDKKITSVSEKQPYVRTIRSDALGSKVVETGNYGVLPIIPMLGNAAGTSELTPNIKSKIDAYDEINSRFVTFLNRTATVIWLINNVGGQPEDIKQMVEELETLGIAMNESGEMSATPQVMNISPDSRQTMLDRLESDIYSDFMALNLHSITGGSLTNVAIKTATANLDMRANALEWQVFTFMQKLLALHGVQSENIAIRRQTIANDAETVTMIYQSRADIDQRTALNKNPLISQDEVDKILANTDADENTGLDDLQKLQEEINVLKAGGENG